MDLLGLVHQYGFQQLEYSLSTYLKSILSLKNVCTIYDTACLYNLNNLQQHSAQFIDNHANEIIKTSEFLNLSPVGVFQRFIFNISDQNQVQPCNGSIREQSLDTGQVHR